MKNIKCQKLYILLNWILMLSTLVGVKGVATLKMPLIEKERGYEEKMPTYLNAEDRELVLPQVAPRYQEQFQPALRKLTR